MNEEMNEEMNGQIFLPSCIIFLTGGGTSFKIYAVVGRTTPTVELLAMAFIPALLIFSK